MLLSDCPEEERRALAALEARIGSAHLRHRLGMEGEAELRVFRKETHFFDLEHSVPMQALLRVALALSGLQARGRRNALRIELRRNEIALSGLPRAFEGYTLLHLSDLHLDVGGAFMERLIDRVHGLVFDACVLTGDYRFGTSGPHGPAMDALARLRPLLGRSVYGVLGNHDTIRMVPPMEAMGIRVLMNESVRLERGGAVIHLAGIDDAHYFRAQGYHKAAGGIPAEACAILLSHTPEAYRHAAHCGFSLMLCGHTHGGQICLPGGVPILTESEAPRTYVRGPWRFGAMLGYTSAGCGTSIVDVRLNCPPEITLHRLVCSRPQ